jgi:DNA modification methylase
MAVAVEARPREARATSAAPHAAPTVNRLVSELYYGDNLPILREYIADESVNLVYLDPPFNSNADYNVLYREHTGGRAAAQVQAFKDTWEWAEAAPTYFETVRQGGPVSEALQGFRRLLGDTPMLAYLAMMAPRLVELRRVLAPTGSLYLHCDSTASHYLKLLLDAIFGPTNFRNEIVWKRFNFHADARRFGRVTDRILFYTKGPDFLFNRLRAPFSDEYVADKFTHVDNDGRRFRLSDLNPPHGRGPVYEFNGVTKPWRFTEDRMLKLAEEGRIYTASRVAQLKRFLDELPGQAVHELWTDIAPINPQAKERLGYQTQKPEALLERIVAASSNEGDTVLDPFCGCGTAIAASQKMGRRWIGIDITHLAITLIKRRLAESFPEAPAYRVIGEPTAVPDAEQLARENPYQFQWWALGLVGARPVADEQRKGADRGIDGRLFFHDDPTTGDTKQIVLSVKAGHTGPDHVRDLLGVLDSERAQIGVLISMQPPTKAMRDAAASAGDYHSPWGRHPRIQLLTVADLLAGRRIDYPPEQQVNVTYRRAPRSRVKAAQTTLPTFDR